MKILKSLFASGLLTISLFALPASAHTVLTKSDPASNSIVNVLPSFISITFAEELVSIGNSNSILAVDESGTALTIGNPEVSGLVLSIKLAPNEVVGLIKVSYRAVAVDAHVITGDYQFTVSPIAIEGTDDNVPTEFARTTNSENKFSIYLIISATLVVGGALLLVFIWKRQPK